MELNEAPGYWHPPVLRCNNTSVNEATDPVSVPDMVEMFWYTTDKPSLFTASGIEITVQGKKYPYEVFSAPGEPDLEWRRRNTYKKFYVQYRSL